MTPIKIRYTFKRKMDGRISQEVLTIEELETKHFLKTLEISHDLIARDMWTGEKDENGVEIFLNDEIEYSYHDQWSDKMVNDSGVVVFKDASFFPLLRNIQDIKVVGNQHTH
jgi:hypothetical protein